MQQRGLGVEECVMMNVEFEMKAWGAQTNSTFLIPNSTLRAERNAE
jgi:hypothetical protein